ncbi:alpha/beta hydrolase family protein [Sphingopyxis sp. MSC1_008]|jgi:predicted dienelactone hydrolase|uniref:alpha/beta hydrolase family protein n=1 Tax=Sphingopyxis sp. MSC1_008 TaxID=2909265 RepID=UPI0020BF760F|nr:dienelactone hydrolase family protein [Sphingopyxis sp. MSC1_008]
MNRTGRLIAPLLMAAATPALTLFTLPAPAAAAEQAYQVGFEQAAIPDQGRAPIAAIIWYPTTAEARDVKIGPIAIKAAPGAPVARSGLPMIVVSHGTGAGAISHIDTAIALAEAGFVVVTPTHNGDNYEDESNIGKTAWFADRSRHIVRMIDFMLGSWRGASNIDKDKIGIFGFSAGATTALIAIGGKPDLGRLAPHCAKTPEFVCRLFPAPDAAVSTPSWSHDPRIAAAAIAAPGLGFLFGPESLARVKAPVQIWAGSDDEIVPYASNTANVRSLLPQATEFHEVKGAGHLSFLAPCPDPSAIPAICTDKPGFDRAAFHSELNAALIAFFRAKLAAP